jgi:hypothetical protein
VRKESKMTEIIAIYYTFVFVVGRKKLMNLITTIKVLNGEVIYD